MFLGQQGVLFKGNLRGKASTSFEKITKRMQVIWISPLPCRYLRCLNTGALFCVISSTFDSQDRFGDQYRLFLLINPEDDEPVAVVVPKQTLQQETTGNMYAHKSVSINLLEEHFLPFYIIYCSKLMKHLILCSCMKKKELHNFICFSLIFNI